MELYAHNIVKIITVSDISRGYYGNAIRVDFGLPYIGDVKKNITVWTDNAVI